MLWRRQGVVLVALSLAAVVATATAHEQKPFLSDDVPLKTGRFLHVTDIHPDQYYEPGAKINDACHAAKGVKRKTGKKRAGYWGAPVSVCDSPQRLVTATFDWLAEHWKDEAGAAFDFIIWTGDTARHDIDFTKPRNANEIFEYNRWALQQLETLFPATPIVPNIGNNDIIPHNIMFPGPNSMTRAYMDIWTVHIPADQQDAFLEGGYFTREVIPGDLAVISLNTLYWYDNNAATRGCKKPSEPGSIELDWLLSQLSDLRQRGLQAHLIGHVPPTAGNYFGDCYDQYTDIVLRFQDTIVGQHFGHMNIDAMFLQEDFSVAFAAATSDMTDDDVSVRSFESDLRKDYDLVPTKQKTNLDAYLPFFAAPSVVPTYFPTVRVWTYNTSRPVDMPSSSNIEKSTSYYIPSTHAHIDANATMWTSDAPPPPLRVFQRSHRRPRHHKHRNRRKIARHASNRSPSRSNQYRTLLGYSQWVLDLPRLNKLHAKHSPKGDKVEYQLEYTTYDEKTLWSEYVSPLADTVEPHIHRPVPKALLEQELTRHKVKSPFVKKMRRLTEYGVPSFTVEHVLKWARELAGNDKLWARYRARIYTESGL